MTEVNLLPPELRHRQRTRQLTLAIVAGVAVVLLLLVGVFLLESARVGRINDALDAQNARNGQLQARINVLQRFDQLKQQVDQRQVLVQGLEATDVLWSGVLHDLSMVIPNQVYLTQMSGTVNVAAGSSTTQASPQGLIGTLQFQGISLTHPDVALWLTRLSEVDGWVNPWVSQSTKSGAMGTSNTAPTTVIFSGTVDLSTAASSSGRAPQ